MAKSAVLRLEDIPENLRHVKLQDIKKPGLQVIEGLMTVKGIIQRGFVRRARCDAQTRQEKAALGFCAGLVNCMHFIGKGKKTKTCSACRKAMANPKNPGTYKRSQYGKIRLKERKLARD